MGLLPGVGKQSIGNSRGRGSPFKFVFSFFLSGVRASITMERILEGWSRFSLSDKEGDRVRLEKKTANI